MRFFSLTAVLALFCVTIWADDLTPEQIKTLANYQQKIDEANGITPPSTQAATQPTVTQLMAVIQVLTDNIAELKSENAQLKHLLAATTKPSDPSTIPAFPPPIGTPEATLVSKWQATKQGDVYVLANGADSKCQNEKVIAGWITPTIGMDEAIFVNYNYGNYKVETQKADERIYGYKPAPNWPKTPHVKSVTVSAKTRKIIAVEKAGV